QARIARVDADTTRRKGRLREILTEFKAHKLDLLLGTQMIAKGLDFPGVTLVGIINADIGLHIPDFRAGERTFQILTQVAGRAGRGELEGEVVVQSYAPHSPSIQFARHHDFGGFADQEMEIRAMLGYPPFARCVLVSTRSTNERLAEFTLENLHLRLKREFPEDAYVGDPNPSPLVRAMDQYRFQFLVRHPRIRALTDPLKAVLKGMTFPEEVYVGVDVDPLSLS
ncbi:MAG: primosomal protein N', partial [Verrucomicrobiales bacterium]